MRDNVGSSSQTRMAAGPWTTSVKLHENYSAYMCMYSVYASPLQGPEFVLFVMSCGNTCTVQCTVFSFCTHTYQVCKRSCLVQDFPLHALKLSCIGHYEQWLCRVLHAKLHGYTVHIHWSVILPTYVCTYHTCTCTVLTAHLFPCLLSLPQFVKLLVGQVDKLVKVLQTKEKLLEGSRKDLKQLQWVSFMKVMGGKRRCCYSNCA